LISYLRRRAAIRGPLGGSRGWTRLWIVLLAFRLLKRLTTSKPEVVFTHELKPGESLLLSADGREPRVIGGNVSQT
jgi:hypothetical protein